MQLDRQITLKKKQIALFFAMFLLATPGIITSLLGRFEWSDTILDLAKVLVYFYIFSIWIKNHRITKGLLITFILYGYLFLVTLLNGGQWIPLLFQASGCIAMFMLVENERDHLENVWRPIIFYLSVMAIINLIFVVLCPGGVYRGTYVYGSTVHDSQPMWIISHKNGMGKFFMFLLFFFSDYDYKTKGKLSGKFYGIAAVCFLNVLLVRSLTALLTISLMLLMIVLAPSTRQKRRKVNNVYLLMGIVAFFFIAIVILQRFASLMNAASVYLGKASTFSGRVPIWNKAWSLFLARPLTGYGFLTGTASRVLYDNIVAADAHNYLLTLMVYGGIIGTGIFLALLIKVIKNVREYQYDYVGVVYTAFLFSFSVMLQFENTSNNLYWLIIAYAFYLHKFSDEQMGIPKPILKLKDVKKQKRKERKKQKKNLKKRNSAA